MGDGQAAAAATVAYMEAMLITRIATHSADERWHIGSSDWFVPSKDGLNYIQQQRGVISGLSSTSVSSSFEDTKRAALRRFLGNPVQMGVQRSRANALDSSICASRGFY